jgi:hypothetical protein
VIMTKIVGNFKNPGRQPIFVSQLIQVFLNFDESLLD